MNVANKIKEKLKKILEKLRSLGVIQTFILEIDFCDIGKNLERSLIEIDSILKKCLKKIINKPKKAEIRNIIGELVRKKNQNDVTTSQKPAAGILLDNKSAGYPCTDNAAPETVLKFQCSFCNEIFNSEKSFTTHKRVHKHPKIYLCDKCGKIFYNFKKWQQHAEEYSKQSVVVKNFQSEVLNNDNNEFQMRNITSESSVVQQSAEELKNPNQKCQPGENHVAVEKEKKFTCACGKVFNILKTLRKHEKLKHSLENIKYTCFTCGKSFLEKGKLNRHMLSHKESQYKCSFCSKQFSRSDTLKRHVSLFHCTSREFLCSFCHKKFKLKFNRDVHEENIHKNADKICVHCKQCGQKFRNKITLKSHLRIHSGNKIQCSKCGKTFSRKTYYKSHMNSKHSGTVSN